MIWRGLQLLVAVAHHSRRVLEVEPSVAMNRTEAKT